MTKRNYPVFNAIEHDCNRHEFKWVNVFEWYNVVDFLEKYKKKPTKDRNKVEFAELLDREFRWMFWSRCQYELILKNWTGKDIEEKIDIYWQIRGNWDTVVNLGWDYVKPRGMK